MLGTLTLVLTLAPQALCPPKHLSCLPCLFVLNSGFLGGGGVVCMSVGVCIYHIAFEGEPWFSRYLYAFTEQGTVRHAGGASAFTC